MSGHSSAKHIQVIIDPSYLYDTPREVNINTRFLSSSGRSAKGPFCVGFCSPSDRSDESARTVVLLSSESFGSAARIADLYADAMVFKGVWLAVGGGKSELRREQKIYGISAIRLARRI